MWLYVGVALCVYLSKSNSTRKLFTTLNCSCNLFCGRKVFTWIFLALEVKSDPCPALAVFGVCPRALKKGIPAGICHSLFSLPAPMGFQWGAGMQTSRSHTRVAAFGGFTLQWRENKYQGRANITWRWQRQTSKRHVLCIKSSANLHLCKCTFNVGQGLSHCND